MWSVILGADKKAIPDDKWDESEKFVWDVYCQRYNPDMNHYKIWLVRRNEKMYIGDAMKSSSSGWWAFSARPDVQSMVGFGSRRYAIGYLLFQTGCYDDVNY